jgi:hypothetical protein
MKREDYQNAKKKITEEQSNLVKQLSELRNKYIESNKPCEIGQNVQVINYADRKIEGTVKGFSIGNNLEVYVDAISPSKGSTIYLSKPHKSIKLL